MFQKGKTNFLLKILTCFTLLLTLIGAIFSLPNFGEKSISASAETVEYQDYLGLEDRTSWASGGHADIVTFGLMDFSITEGNQYFKSSVSGCWYHGNTNVINSNNGMDILQYIDINGERARDLITKNATDGKTTANTGSWLSNPAAWPIAVETGAGENKDCWICIDKTKFGGNFTFTFKKGFQLLRNDGKVISIANDIIYKYENNVLSAKTIDMKYTLSFEGTEVTKSLRPVDSIGELPAVPAKEGYAIVGWAIDGIVITADTVYGYGENKTAKAIYSKDITDTIGLGDWGVPETESDIRYLWIQNGGAEINTAYPNEYWNDHVDNKNHNFSVDILEYILIDGESVRSIINANAAEKTSYKATSTFPLNIGGCYAPISLSTLGDGARFKVMVDYKNSFELTFKAGFTMLTSDGIKLYTTKDVVYRIGETRGNISKVTGYTLTFEGASSRQVEGGSTIGELPAVPEKDGYTGVWMIDGVEITADTVYNYGANKTAVAVYTKDVTDEVKIEFSTYDSVQSTFKIFITPAAALCTNNAWNIQGWDTTLIANNGSVDIMEYIYINDQNIRDLSNDNRTNNTYPVGGGNGLAYE